MFCRDNSYWIPGPAPNYDHVPTLTILRKESTSPTNVIFTLEVSGPHHTSIFLDPVDDAKLVDWSFTKDPLDLSLPPPHYVYWSYALDPTPLRFNVEFEVGSTSKIIFNEFSKITHLINLIYQHANASWSGATFKIAIMGHRTNDDMFIGEDFREFLTEFPPWAHVNAWIGSYGSWQL